MSRLVRLRLESAGIGIGIIRGLYCGLGIGFAVPRPVRVGI
ncbi:MAG TPA: hypothetical protein VGA96_17770 [Fibrella sp.]